MSAPNRAVAKLSDPSLRWVAALYDPRTCAEEPAVPHSTNLSQKIKVFSRGSFQTGTTGYGFIAAAPFLAVANNSSPITATSAASIVTASSTLGTTATVTNSNTNSPHAIAAFGATTGLLNYKLVGAALYVKYAGTELNRGGDMVLVEEPNHNTLFTYSYNTALGLDYAKRVSVSNDWAHVCYTPNSDAECEFNINLAAAPYISPFLGMMVNSAGVVGAPFDFEFYGWYELVGSPARGATIGFADPIGYYGVSGAANQFQQLDSTLGIDGFLHAISTQLDNMSGVGRNATHKQNFAGLAAFLPSLAGIATKALTRAGGALMREFSDPPSRSLAPIPRAKAAVAKPKTQIKKIISESKGKTKTK